MDQRLATFERYFQEHAEEIKLFLIDLVKMETPSGEKQLIDMAIDSLAKKFRGLSEKIEIIPGEIGSSLLVEFGEGDDTLLILGHIDTVWPVEAENKPSLKEEEGILRGPGTLDMKAGLVMSLSVMQCYKALNVEPGKKIRFLVTPDEEISSPTSRVIIEEEARSADMVLVLEPPLADGSMKTRRKGVGEFTVTVSGKEAHAGINPEAGVNAIHEMALQISEMIKLNNAEAGTTLNVDIIEGGTARNVVPGKVTAEVDFRAETFEEGQKVEAWFREIKPILPGAKISVSGGLDRPPMEDSPESNRMADLALNIGEELGVKLKRKLTGGGSDGNFTAALGVPTLDGLGLDGAGAHTPDEHVKIDRIPFRCSLLAELILRI